MRENKIGSYYILIVVFYLFVFQFALMEIIPAFSYWDELYALLAIPLFVVRNRTKIHLRVSNISRIVLFLTIYIVMGLLSNFLYHFQVMKAVMIDVLLQLKFFLGIATTWYIFKNINIKKCKKIKSHAKLITVILLMLVVANKFIHVFPVGDTRFGISSEMLIFGQPTGLASVSFFLVLIIALFYQTKTKDGLFVILGVLLILSTLRFKAIASAMVFCYIYFFIVIRKERLKGWKLVPFFPAVVMVGWDEIYGYFFSANTMDYARGALFHTGIKIARDFFPLGTGFGTFASDPSGDYYSPIYAKYGIQNVWGLGKEWSALVSDSFWPMIMGQTGVIGTVLYVLIIVYLFKLIYPAYEIDRGMYLAAIGAIVYLLISSVAESAFVNPLSLPLALVIGLVICRIKKEKGKL